MKLQESQSWKNIEAALNAEALAYVEYVFYGRQAKKDGYVQMSNLFQETADNELHHAKLLFKKLHDGTVPPTPECLRLASASERYEWDVQYKEFAKVARDEGFDDLGDFFDGLAAIEKSHQERFDVLAGRIQDGEVFEREQVQVWYCTVCGHLHIGTAAPEECPVCGHPQGYFQVRAANY